MPVLTAYQHKEKRRMLRSHERKAKRLLVHYLPRTELFSSMLVFTLPSSIVLLSLRLLFFPEGTGLLSAMLGTVSACLFVLFLSCVLLGFVTAMEGLYLMDGMIDLMPDRGRTAWRCRQGIDLLRIPVMGVFLSLSILKSLLLELRACVTGA